MKFEQYDFSPVIKQNLNKAGFSRPTDIQYKVIPPVLKGEDVLAIAQTGTGKTAAFVIPILQLLLISNKTMGTGIKCLVMAPTRELSLQLTSVFKSLSKGTKISTLCIHGGVEQEPQIKQLNKNADILIATPGRMFDLISQGYLSVEDVRVLVLDEADQMLDLGFINDINQLIKMLPQRRQTLFFSATINPTIKKLAYSIVKNAIRIQISPNDPVTKNVTHSVAFVKIDDKRFFLENIINNNSNSKILIFVRTKVRAERVSSFLNRINIENVTIHSDKNQKDRFVALNSFKDNNVKILIATDISARGIDIPDIDIVVNYDLPVNPENYIHRIGRTGRVKRRGLAISFCDKSELQNKEKIEDLLGKKLEIIEIGRNYYEDIIIQSSETHADWKTIMKQAEDFEKKINLKKINIRKN